MLGWRAALLCVAWQMVGVAARDREVFIAAVVKDWNYAPTGRDLTNLTQNGAWEYLQQSQTRVGPRYTKVVYREFLNGLYVQEVPRSPWLGMLGPLLKAEVGDRLIIHYQNEAPFPTTIHAQGVHLAKDSEVQRTRTPAYYYDDDGYYDDYEYDDDYYGYNDDDNGNNDYDNDEHYDNDDVDDYGDDMVEQEYDVYDHHDTQDQVILKCSWYQDGSDPGSRHDDAVPPGGQYTYVWELRREWGPGEGDPSCVPRLYRSHGPNPSMELESGLLGALVVCKKGTLDGRDHRSDVDYEFVVAMKTFDENLSFFAPNHTSRCGQPAVCQNLARIHDPGYLESNRMYTINGYSFGNMPAFQTCLGNKVAWYVLGLGSSLDLHTLMVDGETLISNSRRATGVSTFAFGFVEAESTLTRAGRKLVYCREDQHMRAGMTAWLEVWDCWGRGYHHTEGESTGQRRFHYLMVTETLWDYAPTGYNNMHGRATVEEGSTESKYLAAGPDRVGSMYKKAVFRGYMDATFEEPLVHPVALGILGPTIRVEMGDSLTVVLYNNASRPYSFYPYGLQPDGNRHGLLDVEVVNPGETKTYHYTVPYSPSTEHGDTPCLTSMYQSVVDPSRDVITGLVGTLLICDPGTLDQEGLQGGVEYEFPLFVSVMDENKSWYMAQTEDAFLVKSQLKPEDPEYIESNKIRAINGRSFANLAGLHMCRGGKAAWHVFSLGGHLDVHALYFHGLDFSHRGHVTDTVVVSPGTTTQFYSIADNVGNWAVVDRNNDHYQKGMSAIYTVLDCGYLRHPVSAAASLSMHPHVRRYFIGVVENYWDYTPVKPKTDNGQVPLFLRSDSRFIGTAYKRAFFKQFTTSSFHEMRMRPEEERHLGFLGPLIRAEEGDVIEIVFQNMASRPYSLHSHLVATDKANEGALYDDKTNIKSDDQVAPGSFQVYRWMVKQGPGSADPNCIASLYYSAVDAEVDAYSGLVGPLVICRKGTLGRDNKRIDVDKEFFLLFSVTDESRSWYLDSNVRVKAWERLGTDFHHDKEFLESNRMPNINGFVQQEDIGLHVRHGDLVAWHVMGFGSTLDVHVVRLHGQPLVGHASNVISVFPEVGESVLMNATNPGTWSVHCDLGNVSPSGLGTTLVVEPKKKSKV